jgi:hypothetical protein
VELAPGLLVQIWSSTMDETRLFRSPRAYNASIRLQHNGWWTLTIDTLYESEPWTIDDRAVYENMSLAECVDALLGEVSVARL